MPVYEKENASFLNQSLLSIWDKQSLKPSQIVLVEDGPLTAALYKVVDGWKLKLGDRLDIVKLENNAGLGKALQAGLLVCKYDLVARMDSDDLSVRDRFESQMAFLNAHPEIDLVGSHIAEFAIQPFDLDRIRLVPTTHSKIVSFSKFRNPFNHPSIVFRRNAVLQAGGYQHLLAMEDYFLWVKMIVAGSKVANIDDPLVHMRTGDGQDMSARRGGLRYAGQEFKFQKKLLQINYITFLEFVRNLFLRVPPRLLSNKWRSKFYQFIRKSVK